MMIPGSGRIALAEVIGTCLLVLAGPGAGLLVGEKIGAVGVALSELVVTTAFVFVVISTTNVGAPALFGGVAAGLMLAVGHLILIPISNASLNPARSLGTAAYQHTWALAQLW